MAIQLTITDSIVEVPTIEQIYSDILSDAVAAYPSIESNMPAELISAIIQTSAKAVHSCATTAANAIFSFSPLSASNIAVSEIGAQLGVARSEFSRVSAYVTFYSAPGVRVNSGSIVGDGTHTYYVADDGVIESSGDTTLFVVALSDGSWATPAGSINQFLSSSPTPYTVSCSNSNDGFLPSGTESDDQYRGRVLLSLRSPAVSCVAYLKSLLYKVGINPRLLSVNSNLTAVYIGGTFDDYKVANAIFNSGLNTNIMVGTTSIVLADNPDLFLIKFTKGVAVDLTATVHWKSPVTSVNNSAVSSRIKQAFADYANSIPIGDAINENALSISIISALSGMLTPKDITLLSFSVTYDGTPVTPIDQEYKVPFAYNYINATTTGIAVTRV
jgi:Baseplate J-like protein